MAVSTSDVFELLQANEDFKELDSGVLHALAKVMRLEPVVGGITFIVEGEEARSMFLLVSGRLRVNRLDRAGTRLMYNEVLPGDCVGETSMILQQRRTANISATRDSIVAILDYEEYEKLVGQFHAGACGY